MERDLILLNSDNKYLFNNFTDDNIVFLIHGETANYYKLLNITTLYKINRAVIINTPEWLPYLEKLPMSKCIIQSNTNVENTNIADVIYVMSDQINPKSDPKIKILREGLPKNISVNDLFKKVRVITFGTYDLFHIGHLNILKRAKLLGDYLIVGISTDALNISKKNRPPVINQEQRMMIVNNIEGVDETFFEESLQKKREYILENKADILVMGDDWEGRFDEFKDICQVIYLPRTPDISTTELRHKINCQ